MSQRRVFVVGLVIDTDRGTEPLDRFDVANWLDGLRDGEHRIIDCTVWDTLGDLTHDLGDRKALRADPVLRAVKKCDRQRSGPGSSGGGKDNAPRL